MNWMDRIALFEPLDFAAVAITFLLWAVIGWLVEHSGARRPSTALLMAQYRREWMQQMITREPRVFDAQTLNTLRQGTAFFASTSVIAIGGALALIGNAERVGGVAEDLTQTNAPAIVWEIKLLILLIFLTNAFLKFVWANRLFGYCSVLMGAVPNDQTDPRAPKIAHKAGEINVTAARSFNRGLRAIYFALASVAFLAGPVPLIAAAVLTTIVIWRREFASHSRRILLAD